MGSSRENQPRTVALFDLDGTLTFRDTLLPFLLGYLRRHPGRWAGLWRLVPALAGYARSGDRGLLKSRVIRLAMGGADRRGARGLRESLRERPQAGPRFSSRRARDRRGAPCGGRPAGAVVGEPGYLCAPDRRAVGLRAHDMHRARLGRESVGRRPQDRQPPRQGKGSLSRVAAPRIPGSGRHRLRQQRLRSSPPAARRPRRPGERRGPRAATGGAISALP